MRKLLSLLFFSLFFAGVLASQNTAELPYLELLYADDLTLIHITAPDGTKLNPSFGLKIAAGSVLVTSGSSAEVRIVPNGSIIRLASSTTFKVEGLASARNEKVNTFRLVSGKLRMVAAKTLSDAPAYQIRTPTAVGGVRGTDFAMQVQEGKKDWLFVRDGLVEFSKAGEGGSAVPGQTILVKAGEYADTFSPVFRPVPVPADGFRSVMQDMEFIKADPASVPSGTPVVAAQPAVQPAAQPAAVQSGTVPTASAEPVTVPAPVQASGPAPMTAAPVQTAPQNREGPAVSSSGSRNLGAEPVFD